MLFTTKRYSLLLILTVFLSQLGIAQILNPVSWSTNISTNSEGTQQLSVTATLEDGWYIYSQHLDEDGPIATSLQLETNSSYTQIGSVSETGKIEKDGYDALFEMQIKKFGKQAVFSQAIESNASHTYQGIHRIHDL